MPPKKLLVLDVNGLLLDTYFHKKPLPNDSPDGKVGNFFVYKRPFCGEFIQFCLENFVVGVWSSAREYNVNSLVDFVFGEWKQDLAFCWHQSDCTDVGLKSPDNELKPLFLKELSKLWEKVKSDLPWDKGDYGPGNTLLVDDTPYKAILNPPNTGIYPQTYTVQNENDDFLGCALRQYLERIRDASNVQEYVENNPFGEPSITSASPMWSYVEQIIERVNEVAMEVGEDVSNNMQFGEPSERHCEQWYHKKKTDLSALLQASEINFPSEAVELEYTTETAQASMDDFNLRGDLHERAEQIDNNDVCSILSNQRPDTERTCLNDEEHVDSRKSLHRDDVESRKEMQVDYQSRMIMQKTFDNGDDAPLQGVYRQPNKHKKQINNHKGYLNDCDFKHENEVPELLHSEVYVECRINKREAEELQVSSVEEIVDGLRSEKGEESGTSSERTLSETVSRYSKDRNEEQDGQDKKGSSERDKKRKYLNDSDLRHEKEGLEGLQSDAHGQFSEQRNENEVAEELQVSSVPKTGEGLGAEKGESAGTPCHRTVSGTPCDRNSKDRDEGDCRDGQDKKHMFEWNERREYLYDHNLRHEKEVSEWLRSEAHVNHSEWRNQKEEAQQLHLSSGAKTVEGLRVEKDELTGIFRGRTPLDSVSRHSIDRDNDCDSLNKKRTCERNEAREYLHDCDSRHEKEISKGLQKEVRVQFSEHSKQEEAEELQLSSVLKTVEGLEPEKEERGGTLCHSETVSRYSKDRDRKFKDRQLRKHKSVQNEQREYVQSCDLRHEQEAREGQPREEHAEWRNKNEAEELHALSVMETLKELGSEKRESARTCTDRMASETVSRHSQEKDGDWNDRQHKKHRSEWNDRRGYLHHHNLRHGREVSEGLQSEDDGQHLEEVVEKPQASSIVKAINGLGSGEGESAKPSRDRIAPENVSRHSRDRNGDWWDGQHKRHEQREYLNDHDGRHTKEISERRQSEVYKRDEHQRKHRSERNEQREYLNDYDLRHVKEMSERRQSEFHVRNRQHKKHDSEWNGQRHGKEMFAIRQSEVSTRDMQCSGRNEQREYLNNCDFRHGKYMFELRQSEVLFKDRQHRSHRSECSEQRKYLDDRDFGTWKRHG